MSADLSRLPVVAGAAQFTNRIEDPTCAPGPLEMMETVARQAAAGAGAIKPSGITHMWMLHSMTLRHRNPAPKLAAMLGTQAETRYAGMGGNMPQWLVNRAAEMVIGGARPVVLIVGAEALATRRRAKKAGVKLDWPTVEGWPDTWPPMEMDFGVHPVERAAGLDQAISMYALAETAIAHAAKRSPQAQLELSGELLERCSDVAATNPYSWFKERRDVKRITTPSPENRPVCWPYLKYANAMLTVDMASALIVTDAQTAREHGLGPTDVAYVTGWADASDIWYLSQRPEIHRSPALAACGEAALAMAGIGLDEVEAFDLYTCFPSSLEVAMDALGLDTSDPRPITLTGGLPSHGGPGSNYTTHAIANMLIALREQRSDIVLVHGNGYYLTKHAIGIYQNVAPCEVPDPGPASSLQERLELAASPMMLSEHLDSIAQVVGYTVPFERDGSPQPGILLVQDGGTRTLARSDPELTAQLMTSDMVGCKVIIRESGTTNSASAA